MTATQYSLLIKFDAAGLTSVIKSGQFVTVVHSATDPGSPPVAWISFLPMEVNSVQWDSSFAVYQCHSPIPTPIPVISPMSAHLGHTYTLGTNGLFHGTTEGPSDVATIVNGTAQAMGVGLAVSFTMNGSLDQLEAIDVVTLQPGAQGAFAPGSIVSIFLTGSMKSGSVLSGVPASALSIDSSSHPFMSVSYDDATGTFRM
ncbi:MAG TPA: hypothetical protein VM733_01870 [Thermoanaerobaculia bacterium]|nr:hypothetical protein [Thermoanaerobaculia bacterium]